ncbi:MAG: hypothetical protein QX197_08795 [Methylococcaceae bacterium]
MTEVTWIDDEGLLRIRHDDNYQMVTFTSASDVELKMDSWDMALACNMVVFGVNMDIKYSIKYGLTECPAGTTGNDRAHHSLTVMNRFLALARSAIAIGILREHDTPANWLDWAKTKGYSVAHLNPAIQIESLQLALQDCPEDCPGVRESYIEQLEEWQAIAVTQPQIEAVVDAGVDSHEVTKPRIGGYKNRDEFVIKLVKSRPELLAMRPGQIKVALQAASNLFTSGYADWWRNNPIFEKGKPGRNPK